MTMKNSTLFRLGLGCISLQVVLQYALRHAQYSNDTIDFLLGLLVGVGLGFLILYMKRARFA